MDPAQIISLRRRLHQIPEPGFLEFQTASFVMDFLDQLKISYRFGKEVLDNSAILEKPSAEEYDFWANLAVASGVTPSRVQLFIEQGTAIVAELPGNRPGPVWGLRVDMDALAITEGSSSEHLPASEGFRSQTPYMHACGHDGHTAIGLALAHRLRDGKFPGAVRIIFQPAEEGVRGALPMVAAGVTQGIDRMLAIHNRERMPTGSILGGVEDHQATTKWRATFQGEPAHASAKPQSGRNALAAAAHASLALLGITRYSSSDTRVNVGTFVAQGSASIIPAQATISYEMRANATEVLEDMDRRGEDIVHGAAQMYNVEVWTSVYGRSINTQPDREMLDLLENAVPHVPGITEFTRTASVKGGSDDAHIFINEVQRNGGIGAYMGFGSQRGESPAHSYLFDFDEQSLGIATDYIEAVFRGEP